MRSQEARQSATPIEPHKLPIGPSGPLSRKKVCLVEVLTVVTECDALGQGSFQLHGYCILFCLIFDWLRIVVELEEWQLVQ